jgi:hypothetical protein
MGSRDWFWLKGIAGRDLRLAQPRRFWFWFKEIARRDLTEKKRRKEKEKGEKKRKKHLEFFFTKLTMRNIEEFCFISIVKRGHLLLPNF